MKKINTQIDDCFIVEPTIFTDDRGFFLEAYHAEKFKDLGITDTFVQDNHSKSCQHTLRGLHLQTEPKAQSKLVRVIKGEIYDVAIDVRPNSPTLGKWISAILSEENKHMLYIPQGFAHGFLVLSETAEISYKCNNLYSKAHEKTILWNDPTLNIPWPLPENAKPLLSEKDQQGLSFNDYLSDQK